MALLAQPSDACAPEWAGQAREAAPIRRRQLKEARAGGDVARSGLAGVQLGVNLLLQGAHRPAQAELRAAQAGLEVWCGQMAAAGPEHAIEALRQAAVVACSHALIEAQLSVPIEPPRQRAAEALAACERAIQASASYAGASSDRAHAEHTVHTLLPWALATAATWLTLLDETSPRAWAQVHGHLQPTLRAGLQAGDGGAARWLLDFIECVQRLGPIPESLGLALEEDIGRLTGGAAAAFEVWTGLDAAWAFAPPAAVAPQEPWTRDRLAPLSAACPVPLVHPEGIRQGQPAQPEDLARALMRVACGRAAARLPWTPSDRSGGLPAWIEAGEGLARSLPSGGRSRLANLWLDAARQLEAHAAKTARPDDAGDEGHGTAVQRLRLAAARLRADDQALWPALDALADAAQGRLRANGLLHREWQQVVHRLATMRPPEGLPPARQRARHLRLLHWLDATAPLPVDPVDEARWLADLAALRRRDRFALELRRQALAVAEREHGPASLDVLMAMQALRDALALHDPAHSELEDLHEEGVERALRVCGPMSPEHWWWRGMRALWWNAQGHGQALQDTAADAELALPLTARNGDADTCACLRLLLDVARSVTPPARLEAPGWTAAGCRVQ